MRNPDFQKQKKNGDVLPLIVESVLYGNRADTRGHAINRSVSCTLCFVHVRLPRLGHLQVGSGKRRASQSVFFLFLVFYGGFLSP